MPSAIGDVVVALGLVVKGALVNDPAVVYVGPKPTSDDAREYVCVAFDPSAETDGVESDQKISNLGNRWVDENGDVTGTVTAWSGDTDTAPLLARVDDILDLIDDALRANPTLGGVLVNGADDGSFARILGRGSLQLRSEARGAVARQTFTVHYSTLLT